MTDRLEMLENVHAIQAHASEVIDSINAKLTSTDAPAILCNAQSLKFVVAVLDAQRKIINCLLENELQTHDELDKLFDLLKK